MSPTNGRNADSHANDDDLTDDADVTPGEYSKMVQLERLESLEEDMTELGVRTLDEVRQRIADLHRELDEER